MKIDQYIDVVLLILMLAVGAGTTSVAIDGIKDHQEARTIRDKSVVEYHSGSAPADYDYPIADIILMLAIQDRSYPFPNKIRYAVYNGSGDESNTNNYTVITPAPLVLDTAWQELTTINMRDAYQNYLMAYDDDTHVVEMYKFDPEEEVWTFYIH